MSEINPEKREVEKVFPEIFGEMGLKCKVIFIDEPTAPKEMWYLKVRILGREPSGEILEFEIAVGSLSEIRESIRRKAQQTVQASSEHN